MDQTQLLKCLFHVVSRSTMPLESVREVVAVGKKGVRAFNLCDGSRTLSDIAKKAKVDRGNLSRSVKRWLTLGVVFWVGEGKEARLLHVYPIPEGKGRPSKVGSR